MCQSQTRLRYVIREFSRACEFRKLSHKRGYFSLPVGAVVRPATVLDLIVNDMLGILLCPVSCTSGDSSTSGAACIAVALAHGYQRPRRGTLPDVPRHLLTEGTHERVPDEAIWAQVLMIVGKVP